MLRVDTAGDTLWTREVGRTDWDRAYSAVGDGTEVTWWWAKAIPATTNTPTVWIVKMDDNGRYRVDQKFQPAR